MPKYEFVTSHTARRTFGNQYLQDGENIFILQHIFGHSKISTTQKYLQVSENHIKKDMAKVFPIEAAILKQSNPFRFD